MIRIVHIKWHDAATQDGWHSKSQLVDTLDSEPQLCESVGMLLDRKNKDKVTILQTFSTNQVLGLFEIPTGCVKSVETLCTLPITIEV